MILKKRKIAFPIISVLACSLILTGCSKDKTVIVEDNPANTDVTSTANPSQDTNSSSDSNGEDTGSSEGSGDKDTPNDESVQDGNADSDGSSSNSSNDSINFIDLAFLDSYPDTKVDLTSVKSLNTAGMEFYEEHLLTGAASLFKAATELTTTDKNQNTQALAYYNLACTISLLYEDEDYQYLDECLSYLEKSFEMRADRVERATKDKDFYNIKDTKAFKSLIEKHKDKIPSKNETSETSKFKTEVLYAEGVKKEIDYSKYSLVIIIDQESINSEKLNVKRVTLDETNYPPTRFTIIGTMDNVSAYVGSYDFEAQKDIKSNETDLGTVTDTILAVDAYLPGDNMSISIVGTHTDSAGKTHDIHFGYSGMRDPEDQPVITFE